jgi:hypothetical protein
MKKMKDFLGNDLAVGDMVVMILPQYRELMKAKIIRFTKCYVILTYDQSYKGEIKQTPDQMIKIMEK